MAVALVHANQIAKFMLAIVTVARNFGVININDDRNDLLAKVVAPE